MPVNPPLAVVNPGAVLHVDSCEQSRLSVGRVIAGIGVDLATFSDAIHAWKRLLEGGIALVIADIHVSGLNGLEFVHQLRATGPTSNIPFVILSRDYRVSVIREAQAAGAAEFLVKPVSPLLLKRIVLKQLGRESECEASSLFRKS